MVAISDHVSPVPPNPPPRRGRKPSTFATGQTSPSILARTKWRGSVTPTRCKLGSDLKHARRHLTVRRGKVRARTPSDMHADTVSRELVAILRDATTTTLDPGTASLSLLLRPAGVHNDVPRRAAFARARVHSRLQGRSYIE